MDQSSDEMLILAYLKCPVWICGYDKAYSYTFITQSNLPANEVMNVFECRSLSASFLVADILRNILRNVHLYNICIVKAFKLCNTNFPALTFTGFVPALVPIHSRSLQASSAVILRQAALCCLMIASEPGVERRKREDGIRQGRKQGKERG